MFWKLFSCFNVRVISDSSNKFGARSFRRSNVHRVYIAIRLDLELLMSTISQKVSSLYEVWQLLQPPGAANVHAAIPTSSDLSLPQAQSLAWEWSAIRADGSILATNFLVCPRLSILTHEPPTLSFCFFDAYRVALVGQTSLGTIETHRKSSVASSRIRSNQIRSGSPRLH